MNVKAILLLLSLTLFLTSCSNGEDFKITTNFLEQNYSEEFHELNLSNQELTQVPNFEKYLTGSYIDNVWSIDLSNNKIKNIDGELFKYFPNLKELNLSYNEIEKVKFKSSSIQDLKLHKNKLTKVDLIGLSKLNTVNLGYNELLSGKDILLPKSVKTLELQHNKLNNLNGIGKLENLTNLKVEFNKLEDSDMLELKNLKLLKLVSVGFNKLSDDLEKKFVKFSEENK